jgi:hypothetical protein
MITVVDAGVWSGAWRLKISTNQMATRPSPKAVASTIRASIR